jgi:DNA-binding NarL/FixJ family response regulator
MPNSVSNATSFRGNDMNRISILIIDDSEVIRLGIAAAMQNEPAFKVIASTSIAQTSAEEICALNPMIVLMDTQGADGNGLEMIKQVREMQPGIKFLVLTLRSEAEAVKEAFDAGVDGYCSKGIRTDFLVTGIKTVAANGRWAGPAIVSMLLAEKTIVHSETRFVARAKLHNGALSAREQEVLNFLVQGFSNTEIGQRLYLSPETIKTHVRHIMEKLSVRDRTQAAVEAVRRGLITAC